MQLKQRTADFRLANLRLTLANMNDIFTVLELEGAPLSDNPNYSENKQKKPGVVPLGKAT